MFSGHSFTREEFVPWHRNRAMKNRWRKYALDIYTDDINALYVVKLEPKPDLFTLFKKKQDLIDFWRFVRHNLYKPSYRVIPVMEKIMSGCGFDLIKKNYDIFTQFNDLTASQIYDLHQSRTVYSCQVRLMLQQHTLYITTKNMTSEKTGFPHSTDVLKTSILRPF